MTPVPDVVPPVSTPTAWRRMACWLYEGMLLFGVLFIADYLFDALSQSRHALTLRPLRMGFLFVVLGIYFTWFWHKGQTLAMKTWHIRVVDAQGRALTQPRALARYVLSWLWVLPPLALTYALGLGGRDLAVLFPGWVVFYALLSRLHTQRQFLHDALAGTRLVHHLPPIPPKKKSQ